MSKGKNKTINMGFVQIAVAGLFLFNANINIIDFLPDIIGYIILCTGLYRIADLNEDIAESFKNFRYMILVELCKIMSLMWIFGLGRHDEQNTGTLLLAFVFAVIDSIILFSAYSKLFTGLLAFGYSNENSSLIYGKSDKGKSYTEKIKGFTLFFVIFKGVMSVLPEFSNLATYEYDESGSFIDIYEYIGLMRGLSFVIVTVVGIVWVAKFVAYFLRINKDKEFINSITDKYVNEVLPRKGFFITRNVRIASLVLIIASIFMFDFRIDDVNIIPDFFGVLLFAFAFYLFGKCIKIKKGLVVSTVVFYLITTVTAHMSEYNFFNNYTMGSVMRSDEAYFAYAFMCIAGVLSAVGFALTVLCVIYCFIKVIENHTGFILGQRGDKDGERIEEYQKESKKRLIILAAAALFAVFTDIFYLFGSGRIEFAGVLSTVGNLVFLCATVKIGSDISSDVETKYMLD